MSKQYWLRLLVALVVPVPAAVFAGGAVFAFSYGSLYGIAYFAVCVWVACVFVAAWKYEDSE